jgi:hypothetical protein
MGLGGSGPQDQSGACAPDLEPTRGLNGRAREARGKQHAPEIIGIDGLRVGDQGMVKETKA